MIIFFFLFVLAAFFLFEFFFLCVCVPLVIFFLSIFHFFNGLKHEREICHVFFSRKREPPKRVKRLIFEEVGEFIGGVIECLFGKILVGETCVDPGEVCFLLSFFLSLLGVPFKTSSTTER